MLDLIRSPFKPAFEEFVNSITTDCLICSPYITFGPIRMLVKTILEKKLDKDVRVDVLTDISLRTLVQGATEISALLYLFENHLNVSVTYLPRIHAKVYISNKSSAIVTSANFTDSGETRNLEYGVKINNSVIVQDIQKDIAEYKKLGAEVTAVQLEQLHTQVENLRKEIQAEQETISRKIQTRLKEQERDVEDTLIRMRVKDRSVNSIFSETILYLLARKPMTTEELHLLIKDIHPDICDDTLDRVIDGKHFGKLWKHQVRNSQVYLRRTGAIYYDKGTRLWHRA